jgi:hypothetical protein
MEPETSSQDPCLDFVEVCKSGDVPKFLVNCAQNSRISAANYRRQCDDIRADLWVTVAEELELAEKRLAKRLASPVSRKPRKPKP